MNDAFGPWSRKCVVGVGTGFKRILAGVNVVSSRGTGGRGLKALGEPHTLFCQGVQVGRVSLTTITTDIEMAGVIRYDENKIGFGSLGTPDRDK